MSKIVDLLTYKKSTSAKKGYEDTFSPKILSENFNTDIKDKIASTYILNSLGKSENLKKDTIKNQHPHPNQTAHLSARVFHLFPWLISFMAVLLLLVNIAYRGKINIRIEVLGGDAGKMVSDTAKNASPQTNLTMASRSKDPVYIPDFLISSGQINNQVIKKIGFYGAALRDSKIMGDGVYLINDGTAGWASAGFDLLEPMDLANDSLEFFAKGLSGHESLELILRDSDNNSYLPQAHNLVFNKNMGSEWQFVSVPFGAFKGYYNPRRINHIGFEFGTQTTYNDSGASIYIKNIKIVKK
ncbi:MAG: hypothetical protein PHI59_02395 [Candidatus Omnitrophica bacterium]|nr:hypothetical protein [Candidatus Omnitrophota bacterium]